MHSYLPNNFIFLIIIILSPDMEIEKNKNTLSENNSFLNSLNVSSVVGIVLNKIY